jgi:hypothetical protein
MSQLTPEQINQIRAKSGLAPLPPKASQAPGAAVVGKYDYLLQDQPKEKEPGFFSKVVTNLKNTFKSGAQNITEDIANAPAVYEKAGGGAGANILTSLSTMGHVAGDVASTAGGILGSFIEPVLPESAKKTIGNVATYIDDKVQSIPGMTPEIHKSLGDVFNAISLLGGNKAATTAKDVTVKTAQTGVNALKNGVESVGDVAQSISQQAPQQFNRAVKLLAAEPSAQVKTILQETPKSVFDDYLKIAQEASTDPRKASVFEKVGDKMTEATKQLKSQADSIGAQKRTIIEKAKVGLQPFIDAPRKAILKVTQLTDNPLKNQVIEKLKSIKTKLDADKVIDEVQSMIYDAKGTKLIAEGSSIEKQLKGILGEMNGALKESLPKAYRDLNVKYSNRAKVIGTLNRALGEVVEGVATRGTGLVKQFFSPAGTKTKELFDFIKKNTGVDLAQDATIAKFMGELFDDPKVKSLLEGLPTTKSGYIEKVIDFVADKTGVGRRWQKTIRKSTVDKARELTK